MADATMTPAINAAILRAEQAGLKLAIKGRFLVCLPFFLWFGIMGYFPANLVGMGAALGFAAVGALHYWLIESGRERTWHRFCFVALDAAALGLMAVNFPLTSGGDVPQIIVFRAYGNGYPFVILAVAALSLSPALVLWAGVSVVAASWAAFGWIVSGMERRRSWSELPENSTREQYLDLFLSPDFIGTGNRVEETIVLLASAALLALAARRARALVHSATQAQLARANLARHVPPNLVEQLANAPEPFGPVRRQEASVLFIDIVGFTALAEQSSPEAAIAFLRNFHRRMAKVVFAHDGTLEDFIGDEVIAIFGTPTPRPDDARRAVWCARAMLDEIEAWNAERAAEGRAPVRVGVGVHAGEVVVGATGDENRLKFTAIGGTMNIASRLQGATREQGAVLIVSEAAASRSGLDLSEGRMTRLQLRGMQNEVRALVFDR